MAASGETSCAALGNPAIEIVAVNDITDSKTLAYLLKYDSVLGNLHQKVTHTDDSIAVDGKSFRVFKTKDPARNRLGVGGRANRRSNPQACSQRLPMRKAHARHRKESDHLGAGDRSRT